MTCDTEIDDTKQAKVIHFEIDPSEVDKMCKTEVAVLDISGSLTALLLSKVKHMNLGTINSKNYMKLN
jgi:thiamine pyrophosphate-dependent acetolactate synthase large subunit-like protein